MESVFCTSIFAAREEESKSSSTESAFTTESSEAVSVTPEDVALSFSNVSFSHSSSAQSFPLPSITTFLNE